MNPGWDTIYEAKPPPSDMALSALWKAFLADSRMAKCSLNLKPSPVSVFAISCAGDKSSPHSEPGNRALFPNTSTSGESPCEVHKNFGLRATPGYFLQLIIGWFGCFQVNFSKYFFQNLTMSFTPTILPMSTWWNRPTPYVVGLKELSELFTGKFGCRIHNYFTRCPCPTQPHLHKTRNGLIGRSIRCYHGRPRESLHLEDLRYL